MARLLIPIGAFVAAAMLLAVAVLAWQARRRPDTSGQYVALGSSFAAGLGLGPRIPGSPTICMRSAGGYPHLLARMTGLSLVDMSCSGSTTRHILDGGQVFLGPQLAAVGPATRLVTITSGGNDVGYIGDLMAGAGRMGLLGRLFAKPPKPVTERNFAQVELNLRTIVTAIRQRAPQAKVVLVSYPRVLPEEGNCHALGISPELAAIARQVAMRLDRATRAAAASAGAIFVDMDEASAGHDACSIDAWVNGADPATGTAFHPNAAGAEATAQTVFRAIAGS